MLRSFLRKLKEDFPPGAGGGAFFGSILIWGIGVGCFAALLNNYLVEIHNVDERGRGILEFFRELPGLGLIFILAFLHKVSDWKVMRLGVLFSMAGVIGLAFPMGGIVGATLLIVLWSVGEHLVMPVRSAIAMQLAAPGRAGHSLGLLSGAMNGGLVAGSALAAMVFYCGTRYWGASGNTLYSVSWCLIFLLLGISFFCSWRGGRSVAASKRPRLYFHRKFGKFYILELFYGARKQIFLTFAPLVLIMHYNMSADKMALLLGICAAVNMFCGPMIGRLTDRIGYRNIMIYDTVILFFVCLFYGFAGDWFPPALAFWVVVLNFILDAVIGSAAMATGLYVREIAKGNEELASTLSTGISANHLVSIIAAPLGGWIWFRYGVGVLFTFSAIMAVLNSLFALTIPRPGAKNAEA